MIQMVVPDAFSITAISNITANEPRSELGAILGMD